MRYISTRGGVEAAPVGFSAAVARGLAADGGLYVPESLPSRDPSECSNVDDLAATAAWMLAPFVEGDALAGELASICRGALSFPLSVREVSGGGTTARLLELFHGPTAAFKDVGARFLAECLARLEPAAERTVLVATSGDTGGAVAAAFHKRPGFRVVVMFPDGGVSPRQQHQLTCFGDNVLAFAVKGTFDDCQRILKAALADAELVRCHGLTTANSINIARLLPQAVYYAHAAMWMLRERGVCPTMVVPSGNVGNATAALWAKAMGFPIAGVVLACNDNRTLAEFFDSGEWRPRASVQTIANAMDVGNPSNMERVFHMFPDREALRRDVRAVAVDDAVIRDVIRLWRERYGYVLCPHTATAAFAADRLDVENPVVVATAHPAKFPEVVEPLIGAEVTPPTALAELLARPTSFDRMEPSLDALREVLG